MECKKLREISFVSYEWPWLSGGSFHFASAFVTVCSNHLSNCVVDKNLRRPTL